MSSTKQKLEVLRNNFQNEVAKFFKEEAAAFFEKYPNVNSISVPMYTPYFNDGEACTFGVASYNTEINGIGEDYCKEDIKDICETEQEFDKIYLEAVKFIEQFDDSDWQFLVPEEGLVTINRDGSMSVEYYNHE